MSTGHFLVDATYEPVNKLEDKTRETVILESYDDLVKDLESLGNPDEIRLVLIKANICRLLEHRLNACGFKNTNGGSPIDIKVKEFWGHNTYSTGSF